MQAASCWQLALTRVRELSKEHCQKRLVAFTFTASQVRSEFVAEET